MQHANPILLEKCEIVLPDLAVSRFSLNRHLPETNWVSEHRHPNFEQMLLYLTGSGVQRVDGERWPVVVGSVVVLPRGTSHAFIKTRQRAPLCLAIDLETPVFESPCQSTLNASELASIKRELIELGQVANVSSAREAGLILSVTGRLIDSLTRYRLPEKSSSSRLADHVRKVIADAGFREKLTPRAIADELGMSHDHLNRKLKLECGLTTGQLLAEVRLETAKATLTNTTHEIQQVAEQVGFLDPNYFARWFRQQTGVSPRDWRKTQLD